MPKPFNENFKQTMVDLFHSGKPVTYLSREYGVSEPTLYTWINCKKEIKVDNDSTLISKIDAFKKENLHLKVENEILKTTSYSLENTDNQRRHLSFYGRSS